jgi:hypothetical protein
MTAAAASSDWAGPKVHCSCGATTPLRQCGSPVAPACAAAGADGTSSSIRTVRRPVRTGRLRRWTINRPRHLGGCPGLCDQASMTRTWRVPESRGVVRRPRRCCALRSTAGCGRRPRPRPGKRPAQASCAVSARRRKPCFDGAATPELQVPTAPVGLFGCVTPGCGPGSCARSRFGAASRPLRCPGPERRLYRSTPRRSVGGTRDGAAATARTREGVGDVTVRPAVLALADG